MNYVGRFFSNFKGFYNDINSATLTGAIDVLVVRQSDGTFLTSPWHVRFGKMGVIRAREKQVDIEVNGLSVNLSMKLGEAGEAFFLHQIDESPSINNNIKPISTLNLLDLNNDKPGETNIMNLESNFENLEIQETCKMVITIDGDDVNVYPDSSIGLDANASITNKDKTNLINNELNQNELINKMPFENITLDNNQYFASYDHHNHSNQPADSGNSFDHHINKNQLIYSEISTQTDMSGSDVEAKKSRNPSGDLKIYSSPIPSSTLFESALYKSTSHVHRNASTSISGLTTEIKDEIDKAIDNCSTNLNSSNMSESPSYTIETKVRKTTKIKHKHLKKPKDLQASDQNNLLDFKDEVEGELKPVKYSEIIEGDDNIQNSDLKGSTVFSGYFPTDDWSKNDFVTNQHPFSDTDISPCMSPVISRPCSPKSDSEIEIQRLDGITQTQLTGDELHAIDDVKWVWGEFPQPSPAASSKKSLQLNYSKPNSDESKLTGGLFQFMRKTKKLRHHPETQGIYLEDLNLNEMDPEIASLYLYKPGFSSSNTLQSYAKDIVSIPIKDEDVGNGNGYSLPHSTSNSLIEQIDSNHVIQNSTLNHVSNIADDLINNKNLLNVNNQNSESLQLIVDCSEHLKNEELYNDLALSLCGGLDESDQTTLSEKFAKNQLTYESFCDNINIMNDPNLVIRLNGKYFCWAVAGPMIISVLVFQKQLSDSSLNQLMKIHMSKKERKKWWWNRTYAQPTTISNASQAITLNTAITSPSKDSTMDLNKNTSKLLETEILSSGDESDHILNNKEKFLKSLKLTSKQIESLNLREGANEASFSVTTQYQGTSRCSCYIYLWNWDDRIVVSDIDGTITRSDVWGQVLPMIGKDWSQAGIAQLYSMINNSGYKFLYLSARAIGQSKITRDYLHSVRQGNISLPSGPLLLSPSSLLSAFYKEVIERKPEEFKIGCLRDISVLFPPSRSPFYAGFGNKINDAYAYRTVGIPISRIFTVNSKGELRMDMTMSFQSSYTKLSDIADHLFPPLLLCNRDNEMIESGKFPGAREYSTFTYWRSQLPDVDKNLTEILASVNEKKSPINSKKNEMDKIKAAKDLKKSIKK